MEYLKFFCSNKTILVIFAFDTPVRHICKIYKKMFKIGLDIGSTTAKIVVIDENDKIIFSRYRRHNTQMMDVVLSYLNELESIIGNEKVSLNVSGSAGTLRIGSHSEQQH